MDITEKIDGLLNESIGWKNDMGISNKLMDKKTQVEVIWKPGQKEVKVQFRNIKTREYIGHAMVATKGMKSKDFLKYVDSDMKKIWNKAKGMNEGTVTKAEYIDLVNVTGNNLIQYPNDATPKIPSKKTVNKYDEIYLAGSYNTWGVVEDTLGNTVKVNLNPGMGNRPKIVNVKYDQVVFWRYKGSTTVKGYVYVNKNRIIK